MRLQISYVLPLAASPDEDVAELAAYLRWLATEVDDVVVVDGSAAPVVEAHRTAFGPDLRVLVPAVRTLNGKVGNVLTGVEHARHPDVVLADDDIRYELDQLRELRRRLGVATVVRPQNRFDPLPWHARVDTARTLLTRVAGGDWPGTLAIRRDALIDAGGYAGDVLFENLELVRTLRAAGGTEHLALDVVVRRVPPTSRHFRGQQVRQAYDELARPARFVASLAVAPAVAAAVRDRRVRALTVAGLVVAGAAEAGRSRAGGRRHYPASSVAIAPLWLVWRSSCSWVAVGAWVRGGARYRGRRLRRAATPMRVLRRRTIDAAYRRRRENRAPSSVPATAPSVPSAV